MLPISRRLHEAAAAVCPILSVSSDGTVQPASGATGQQIAAAEAAVAAVDRSFQAQAAWEADRVPERKALRDAAQQAVADLDTFLAIPSPTNAQNAAAVRRLAQMMRAVIRRLVQLD